MKTFLLSIAVMFCSLQTIANYSTPGTGVKYDLNQLVASSAGDVTFANGIYQVNDTIVISNRDTLSIITNETVKFAQGTFLSVKGVLIVNPPTSVLFTAINSATPFLGVWIELNSGSKLKKLTFEYANSLRLTDANAIIDSCIFRNNTPLSTFGNSAINLLRSSPIITNSSFINNQRAAIQGGANIDNAPKIYNCIFQGNNTLNQNVPQINLGPTGTDTCKIIGNKFLAASTNSGAIGFLPLGNVNVIISNNLIQDNRYGITMNGGANINSLISYNHIVNNNTGANPLTGGSGIAYSGGTATSQQRSIVSGNYFSGNLWGITIQGRSKPNLGNLSNTDTTDDGKNYFINNTNSSTPGVDVYNNSIDTIYAQNNFWGVEDSAQIETKIFHRADQATLGLVIFTPFAKQVNILNFTATLVNHAAVLNWQHSTEFNTLSYVIEKSIDGVNFQPLDSLYATAIASYNFTDRDIQINTKYYYRIKAISMYGYTSYSEIKWVIDELTGFTISQPYPTAITANNQINFSIATDKAQVINISIFQNDGRMIWKSQHTAQPGYSTLTVRPTLIARGLLYLRVIANGETKTYNLFR